MLEAPGFVAGLGDVAVMGNAIQKRGGHLLIVEDLRPLGEREIGGDDHRDLLVEAIEQMEQQGPAGLAEWEVAKLVQDDAVHARALAKRGAGAVATVFSFQPVNGVKHGEEACAAAVLDELAGDRHREMGLPLSSWL
jgi:hypothetical protein